MDDVDKVEQYEPPHLEVIGSLHDLTQATVGKGGPFTDAFGPSNITAQVS